jgi:hypothetical protein
MRGAGASGAVNIKVGACDIEAMSPPMVPMARGGVIKSSTENWWLTSLERRMETLLRQRREIFCRLPQPPVPSTPSGGRAERMCFSATPMVFVTCQPSASLSYGAPSPANFSLRVFDLPFGVNFERFWPFIRGLTRHLLKPILRINVTVQTKGFTIFY